MATAAMDQRRVPLGEGSVAWLFPMLIDPLQAAAVVDQLHVVDLQLDHLGRLLGLRPGGYEWNSPLNRLTYYRLGPAPQLPKTELISEGWSDRLSVLARLWAPNAWGDVGAAVDVGGVDRAGL